MSELFEGYAFEPSGKVPDDVTMYYDLEPEPDIWSPWRGLGEGSEFTGSHYTNLFKELLAQHTEQKKENKS